MQWPRFWYNNFFFRKKVTTKKQHLPPHKRGFKKNGNFSSFLLFLFWIKQVLFFFLKPYKGGRRYFEVEVIGKSKSTNSWEVSVGIVPQSFSFRHTKLWIGAQKSWGYIMGTGFFLFFFSIFFISFSRNFIWQHINLFSKYCFRVRTSSLFSLLEWKN